MTKAAKPDRKSALSEIGLRVRSFAASPVGDGGADAASVQSMLDYLSSILGLSSFEQQTLLLCACAEIDSEFPPFCALALQDADTSFPTPELCKSLFKGFQWDAFSPVGALRRWRLIDWDASRTASAAHLKIDERILHFLLGTSYVDERLTGCVEIIEPAGELVPSHARVASEITALVKDEHAQPAALQICGADRMDRESVARTACAGCDLGLVALRLGSVSAESIGSQTILTLVEREAILNQCALLLDCETVEPHDTMREEFVGRFVERAVCPVIVSVSQRHRPWRRPTPAFDVGKPHYDEQLELWSAVTDKSEAIRLAGQFDLTTSEITAISGAASQRVKVGKSNRAASTALASLLWNECRTRSRMRLDDLAQRVEPTASWDDLVLPAPEVATLKEMLNHVQHCGEIYRTWGFAGKSRRGLGISALFSGGSGAGKTMAAEVLSADLGLDLYRVDLSATVSKYIGETEKNLARIFDAAEAGGVILLFDEADALFGKRSDVKDSHDRFANIEISYLLQRVEAFKGLAILTSNMKSALDKAFLRRIRFLVDFPFPDAADRALIWSRVFPKQTPTDSLDYVKLARLSIMGGNIRNIAMQAAFLAIDVDEPVRMRHVLEAARSEFAKLDKPLPESDVYDWV